MARLTDRITPETMVRINISGSSNGKKITISESLTVAALGATVAGAAPVYPAAEIAAIALNGSLTDAQKQAQTKEITDAYSRALSAFGNAGGVSIQNQIATKVLAYVKSNYNVAEAGNDRWNLTAGNLTVTPVEEAGAVVVIVSGAPVWGS